MFLPQTLLSIVRSGGNIKIDGSKYLPQTLIQLARMIALSDAQSMEIKNASALLPQTLVEIARAGKGKVIFDIDI